MIALDVLEALIEATYTRERTQHLRRANLGIEKLRFLLRLAADLRLLDRRRYEHAARTLDDTGRLVGGWMKVHRASIREATAKTIPQRHDNLFAGIANFQALHAAARRAVKGKRKKPGAAAFFANLEGEILALERQLRAGNIGRAATSLSKSAIRKSASCRPRPSGTASCIMPSVRSWSRSSRRASSTIASPIGPARARIGYRGL